GPDLEFGCSPRSTSLFLTAVPAGLEPAPVWLTASRTTVVLRDSKSSAERPAGVEPARRRWERRRLPLHHGRLQWLRWDLNPRHPRFCAWVVCRVAYRAARVRHTLMYCRTRRA